MGQYEEIRDMVGSLISDSFATMDLVEEKFYKRPFYNADLNFNLYKNNGNILPEEYKYFDKQGGYYINIAKGHWWLPKYIYTMEKYKELNLLPAAFILLFFREYGTLLNCSRFECADIIAAATEELLDNKYDVPDYRCKNFLIRHSECNSNIGIQLYESGENLALGQLSALIVESIYNILNLYKLEYWRFPDEEIERAYSLERQAQKLYWTTITRNLS